MISASALKAAAAATFPAIPICARAEFPTAGLCIIEKDAFLRAAAASGSAFRRKLNARTVEFRDAANLNGC
jgi:hypothetical protein